MVVLLKVTSFVYKPGNKWDCGVFKFEADTPLGLWVWDEVVPGPRHGEDYKYLKCTLNGKRVDDFLDNWGDGPLTELDFDPPGKPGKWADQFSQSEDEIEETLQAWWAKNEAELTKLLAS